MKAPLRREGREAPPASRSGQRCIPCQETSCFGASDEEFGVLLSRAGLRTVSCETILERRSAVEMLSDRLDYELVDPDKARHDQSDELLREDVLAYGGWWLGFEGGVDG